MEREIAPSFKYDRAHDGQEINELGKNSNHGNLPLQKIAKSDDC
jgi:hypothetical protein